MEPTHILRRDPTFSLSFSFFAGPAAWALQLLIGYGLLAHACMAGTKLWIFLVNGAAVVIVFIAAVLAYRNWRGYANSRDPGSGSMIFDIESSISRQEFIAISGALLSSVFLLLILVTGIAMIFLNPCPTIMMPLP